MATKKSTQARAVRQALLGMNTSIPSEIGKQIEEQREHLFRAMNLVRTTALSCGEGDLDRKGTLGAACDIIDDVALELNKIEDGLKEAS